MSLELISESVKILRFIGENSIQTVIDNDIIVPDAKPDIGEILLLDGEVTVIDTEVLQEKLIANGKIRYQILYVSDEEARSIKNISFCTNFSCNMEVEGAKAGMKGNCKLDIENIDYSIFNGRKINVKSVISAEGKVMNEIEQEIISDLRGIDNLQVLKDKTDINCYIGSNRSEYKLSESMDIPGSKPAVKDILRNDIKILAKDHKVTDNKIIVKGELNISTLYAGYDEEQILQFMEHEIPFTRFIDLPGIDETSDCKVVCRVIDSSFEASENSDGEFRMLNGEITILIDVEGFRRINTDLLLDAYAPKMRIDFESEYFSVEEPVTEDRSQVIIKDTAVTESDSPEIAEVFNVISRPALNGYSIADDKLTVEGVVSSNILYLANNGEHPVYCLQKEFPFKQTADIKGLRQDMGCEINLEIEHCNYSMLSQEEIDVRIVVGIDTKVKKQVNVPIIVKATDVPANERESEEQPGIIVYFAKPGDTLWSVAKRYLTTIDEVKRNNDLSGDDFIHVGQQIFIYS